MLWSLLACVTESAISTDADTDKDGVITEDCAPEDGSIFPGAPEICNGVDDDCDGDIDELFDLDADGFLADEAACRALGAPTDCDDTNPDVAPGVTEVCNARDDDCDNIVDNVEDADSDGVNACDDCDDADPFVSPDAPEACDGLDNDCSGAADEAWDLDGDGASSCGGDCDENDYHNSAHLPEVCDGQDNDCDGVADEDFDLDGDGYLSCENDCDDSNPASYPGATEICDGFDNDCDPSTEEAVDVDGDGYTVCDGDCNDASVAAGPHMDEGCDGLDNDCNGATDELPGCYGCYDLGDYLVCTSYVDWNTAETACQNFGRHLVSIPDSATNDTVSSLASTYTGYYVWIGFSDQTTEGSFIWSDGTAVTFSQWYSGEPNDSGGEDCAGMNYGALTYWNDWPCSATLPFVCGG